MSGEALSHHTLVVHHHHRQSLRRLAVSCAAASVEDARLRDNGRGASDVWWFEGLMRGEIGMGTRVRVQEAIEDMKLDEFVAAYGTTTEWELENPEAQIKQLEKDIAMAKAAGLTEVRPLPLNPVWPLGSLLALWDSGRLSNATSTHCCSATKPESSF